jgi:hypothetical protein
VTDFDGSEIGLHEGFNEATPVNLHQQLAVQASPTPKYDATIKSDDTFEEVVQVTSPFTDGAQHRMGNVAPQSYSARATFVTARVDKLARPVYDLFLEEDAETHLPHAIFYQDDPKLRAAFLNMTLIPQKRVVIDYEITYHYDQTTKRNVCDEMVNRAPSGAELADEFDAMPLVAIVDQIEASAVSWLLYTADGPLAFPPEDALIERQSHLLGNLPGKDGKPSDYERLMVHGEAIAVSWRVEHRDGVVTKLDVLLDGKVFVPNWDAAVETQKQLDELKKTEPVSGNEVVRYGTKENLPVVDKPRSNVQPAMMAFASQCKAGNVPDDVLLRDRIRHEATGGASWRELTDFSGPLMATKAIIDAGTWRRWQADPDGSRADFAAITEGRETAPNLLATSLDDQQGIFVSPAASFAPNSTIQGETVKQYNYQPIAVWPTDRGCTVFRGVRFSVTLYAPDATWDDAVRLMEQFTDHPESIHPSCRVQPQTAPQVAPLASAAPARVPAVNDAPPQAAAPAGDKPSKSESGFAIARNVNNGKLTYAIFFNLGTGGESKYPLNISGHAVDQLEVKLEQAGLSPAKWEPGKRYMLAVKATWVQGKETEAGSGKFYKDFTNFEVLKEETAMPF